MKKIILLTNIMLVALTIQAQQRLSYAYDAVGNRIGRSIVLDTRRANVSTNNADSVFFEEMLADKQIKIYPNPVQSQLTIAVEGFETGIQGEFSLFNIAGIVLARQRITNGMTYVDMSRYIKGIYLLNIKINGESTHWKVIKE